MLKQITIETDLLGLLCLCYEAMISFFFIITFTLKCTKSAFKQISSGAVQNAKKKVK